MSWQVLHGDCLELLREWQPGSARARSWIGIPPFDSCVTDPPYGLGFMGRDWDSPDNIAFRPATWQLVLRALKPGAHLLAFGGTRTFHRLTVAIEDAGFEVRDVLCWLYGQGMPKSLDVSKAIDKAAGAEREVVGTRTVNDIRGGNYGSSHGESYRTTEHAITAPATPEAQQWDGWGTALSPSWEPIVLARKPLSSTVAANVVEHGTGGLNIDGCRLPTSETERAIIDSRSGAGRGTIFPHAGRDTGERFTSHPAGRWPPNVALDEEAAAAVDRQSGTLTSGGGDKRGGCQFFMGGDKRTIPTGHRVDTGGASRFFYCSKASPAERNAGLGDEQNPHPTVKPVALMRWLCRLVTPGGGLVLDPFCGSGSTGFAAALEGFRFLGLEQDAEAVRVAKLRLHHCRPDPAQVADVEPPRGKQGRLF